jgi:hypothetical protein
MKITTDFLKTEITKQLKTRPDLLDKVFAEYKEETLTQASTTEEKFFNGKNWARTAKLTMAKYLDIQGNGEEFIPNEIAQREDGDYIGFLDRELFSSIPKEEMGKCIMREFRPKNDLFADTFCFEIITTPADDAIVAFGLFLD